MIVVPQSMRTAILILFLLLSTSVSVSPANALNAETILGSHWVPGWGFRDELNKSDIDNQNFWTDNAGKILTSGVITNDLVDADRALGFIQSHMTASYYLPELVVNSSVFEPQVGGESNSVTNRIVLLGTNPSRPELQQLSIGDYYAGPWTAGYLGADRIWYNGSAHRAVNATVTVSTDHFVKKAYFSFDGLSFYTYLNSTVSVGDPYVKTSVQIKPLNSTFGAGDYIYLQVFAGGSGKLQQYAFENATSFDGAGNLVRTVPFDGATPLGSSGMVVAYSNRTSVLEQDSVALRFNATGIYDVEHWYLNGPFDGLSWVGLGYKVPAVGQGKLSAPVYADVYPIQHFDHHLMADTAKYIASNPRNVSVAPPVSFGFVARGLALYSNLHPDNQTLRKLATGYFHSYYRRYAGTYPGTAYSRSLNVFALAGFELYGGNSSVENFTREFVGAFPGASVEEYGWAVAALQTLYLYTNSSSDLKLYKDALGSFVAGGDHFVRLKGNVSQPAYTFQFAEAASGLLTGKVPYNNTVVLWALDAVFQSNSSGILQNQPRKSDLANTETIPAYMLSTWLFKNAMRSQTRDWIQWVQSANITSIDYGGGQLKVDVLGRNGSLALGTSDGIVIYHGINGTEQLLYPPSSFPWTLIFEIAVATVVILLVIGYFFLRKTRSR
ncbi:MAG: hypothetical protein OK452_09250 [Thaumarchaeota archaeon]|nr:hypothetical protein [Nitrososphaerota archaeon]